MASYNTLIQPYIFLAVSNTITNDCFLSSPSKMYFYEFTAQQQLHFIPSPYTELIFCYNENGSGCIFCMRCCLQKQTLNLESFAHYFCVRFDESLFYRLSNAPFPLPAHLSDCNAPYFPKQGSREALLIAELAAAASFQERIRIFQSHLTHAPAKAICPPGAAMIHHAVKKAEGFITINELSMITGYSNRHINRIFTTYFGYGPKEFSKFVRFHHSLMEIIREPQRNNSQFITQMGYSDQAHFQREFKSYMGETPRQYIKKLPDSRQP